MRDTRVGLCISSPGFVLTVGNINNEIEANAQRRAKRLGITLELVLYLP